MPDLTGEIKYTYTISQRKQYIGILLFYNPSPRFSWGCSSGNPILVLGLCSRFFFFWVVFEVLVLEFGGTVRVS